MPAARPGARIAATAGPMFKRTSLELGGKNAVVICEDADLDAAMPSIVRSCFPAPAEICTCGSRILVHRDRMKAFVSRFLDSVAGLLEKERELGELKLEAAQHEGRAWPVPHADRREDDLAYRRGSGRGVGRA